MADCVECGQECFRYQMVNGKEVCYPCLKPGTIGDKKLTTFPYTSTHITGDGQPIEVKSLRHLRKLEGQFGVHCDAYR